MSLAELQERWPLHSRWWDRNALGELMVVGHGAGAWPIFVEYTSQPDGSVLLQRHSTADAERWDRIPDPPPCPVTKVVTYRSSQVAGLSELGDRFGGPHIITLHPPGADIGDQPHGVYTWGTP